MDEPFSRYHPAITFLFFIAAIVFAMFFVHPAYLLADLVFACLFFLLIKGSSGLKFLGGMAVLVVVLTFLNPLFNTSGPTVLFTYFGGRPYTLEALLYGLAIAVMFATVLIWFACYNATMSSDKFIYLFGKFAPSVSLVLTMVLRLVPNYRRQADKISSARMCVGKSPSEGPRKEKLGSGVTVLSAM
ncbi:MAG: energy-coupling factor transporter transmembrane component T, partial [Coriobacteriales bacterium]